MKPINYQAWAPYKNFDVFTASALWCERNPYYFSEWDNWEFVEVRNLIIHIFRYQLDAENYPENKRNVAILELAGRMDKGMDAVFDECKKIILSREQLKAIAIKTGVRPKFLFSVQEQSQLIEDASNDDGSTDSQGCLSYLNIQGEPEIADDSYTASTFDTSPKVLSAKEVVKQSGNKPWLIPNPLDPRPEQDWYISARYFARKLVQDDSSLLTKRDLLSSKVVKSLDAVGIKKRGGLKSFSSGTIKKALSNIVLG